MRASAQADLGPPAERRDARAVEQLARHAVGLGGVVGKLASVAERFGDERRKLGDRLIGARANVDQRRLRRRDQFAKFGIGEPHQEYAGFGHVVAEQEFAPRPAAAPERHPALAALLRLVDLAHQRRQHVGVLQVVAVARPVQVGRHRGEETRAVLAVVGPAHLHPGLIGWGQSRG